MSLSSHRKRMEPVPQEIVDRPQNEWFRCRLGGVTMSVRSFGGLVPEETLVRGRMADFLCRKPEMLRLNISQPIPAGPMPFEEKDPGPEKIFEGVRNAWGRNDLPAQLRWLHRLRQHISGPDDARQIKALGDRCGAMTVVPLVGGVLFVKDSVREAWLLSEATQQAFDSAAAESSPVPSHTLVINAAAAFLSVYMADHGDGGIAHGTGVCERGQGYLFVAPSGGGKTTVSVRSSPGAVLADDGTIVRKTDGRYRLFPTPLRQRPGGETAQWDWHQDPVPLRAVFFLSKSRENRVVPIARARAVSDLINAYSHFTAWMHPRQLVGVFDFWRRLSVNVPMAELKWQRDADVWPAIKKFLASGKKAK